MGGACSIHGKGGGIENAHNIIIGNREGKRPLWRPTHTGEDDIKMVGRESVD
jgi:hypothetical protein